MRSSKSAILTWFSRILMSWKLDTQYLRAKQRDCQLHHFLFFSVSRGQNQFSFFSEILVCLWPSSREKKRKWCRWQSLRFAQVRRVKLSAQNSEKTTEKVHDQLKSNCWPAKPVRVRISIELGIGLKLNFAEGIHCATNYSRINYTWNSVYIL